MTTPGWAQLPVYVLQLELEMRADFRLPPFAGSLFRGVLGWALRDVCPDDVYRYLFETESNAPGQQDALRPFVVIPPIRGRNLRAGDRFQLELKLFGGGCDYLEAFLEALRRAGHYGLGREQARFEIVRILVDEGLRRWVAFDRACGWPRAHFPLPSALGAFAPPPGMDVPSLELEFFTPTRLVHQGEPVPLPDFHVILRALYRRLDGLLQHHGGQCLEVDFKEDIAAAQCIAASHEVEWVDWERTSNRQGKRHKMGGLVGRSRFAGDFAPHWIELLGAGQVAHLGKATTFGMGAYRLQFDE